MDNIERNIRPDIFFANVNTPPQNNQKEISTQKENIPPQNERIQKLRRFLKNPYAFQAPESLQEANDNTKN